MGLLGVGIRITAGFAALAWASNALAFFDGFDGNRLNDQWQWWSEFHGYAVYDVSDSNLNVYRLEQDNGLDGGSVYLDTPIELLRNFEMSVAVSWEPGRNQRFDVQISDSYSYPGYFNIARMWYAVDASGNDRYYRAQTTGTASERKVAPASGRHIFKLARTEGLLNAYFDGELFFSTTDVSRERAAYAILGFTGSGSEFTPIRADSVEVIVPEPSTLFGLAALLLVTRQARRAFALSSTRATGQVTLNERE